MNTIDISLYDQRVMDLAKRICDLYSVSELEKLAPISPQTIQRWADGKHRPSKSTASTLSQIIAVSDDDYNKYLNGDITLDDLWTLKGTAKRVTSKQEITIQSVLNDAKRLSTKDRLKLMSGLFMTIAPKELSVIESESSKPQFVELSDTAKKRLKVLLDISNIYLQQTYQTIIESGVDKALVEDIVNGIGNSYTRDIYHTLMLFLCRCTEWRDTVPLNVNPANYFESLDELIESLESSSD